MNLVSTLSAAELKIYNLLVSGKSNAEIADSLFLSVSTVKFHMTHIFQKLGVNSRAGAIAYGRGDGDGEGGGYAPMLTDGKTFTEQQIKEAARVLVELGLADRKVVNAVVLDLLGVLGGKIK